ncbi:MAG TPA: tetratricopeptide repeat-containing sensor histidine kinase [Fulvivirga sp.]|nr:tetratricopeptide repeat-containing sensor histidine kinase [Fulvivirga sp.]
MKRIYLMIIICGIGLTGFSQISTTTDSLKTALSRSTSDTQKLRILLKLSEYKEGKSMDANESLAFANEAKLLANKIGDNRAYHRALTLQGNTLSSIGKSEAGIDTLKIALSLIKNTHYDTLIAESYFVLGAAQEKIKNFKSALGNFEKSLTHYTNLNDSLSISSVFNYLGIVHFHLGNLPASLDYYQQSLALKKQLNLEDQLVQTYNNIAMVYKNLGNLEKALLYNKKSMAVKGVLNDTFSLSISYLNLGNIYRQMKQYDSAIMSQKTALKLSEGIKDTVGIAYAMYNLGSAYYNQKQFVDSEKAYTKALALFKKNNLNSLVMACYNSLSIVMREANNLNKATEYALNALELAKQFNTKPELKLIYETLYNLSKVKGDFETALMYHEQFTAYSDSLLNQQKIEAIKELETNFEITQRDSKIELLNKNHELNTLALSQAKRTKVLFIILSLLLLGILVVTYRNFKIKKKSEKELSEKNNQLKELNAAKDKFFAIIAHDLRNPLSAFQSLSTGLAENFKQLSENDLENYLVNLKKSSEQLVNLLHNLLQWALSQTNKLTKHTEPLDINAILQKNIDLLKENAAQKKVSIKTEISSDSIAFGDAHTIDIVFRNLISNAIKFNNPGGDIVIKTKKEENQLTISIIDTGIGMTEDDTRKLFSIVEDTSSIGNSREKGTGLGLILCKEFIDKNNGEIMVESKIGEGTIFNVILPLNKLDKAA